MPAAANVEIQAEDQAERKTNRKEEATVRDREWMVDI